MSVLWSSITLIYHNINILYVIRSYSFSYRANYYLLGFLIPDCFQRFLLIPHLSDDILLHNAHNIRMFYLLQDIHENHWQVVYYTQGICHALVYL